MRSKYYDIVKSAASQTNNKSSKYDSMTAEFCKNIYQKTYLNNFRLEILGNKKVLKKSQIRWRQILVPSLFPRNHFLLMEVENYTLQKFIIAGKNL